MMIRRLRSRIPIHVFIIASMIASSASTSQGNGGGDECVYTVYVKTGSVVKGGTDAKIGLTVGDAAGRSVRVDDIASWGGLMGPDHDYFERGSLDAFSGRGPCGLSAPLCRLNLTSDGGGSHHGWFCDSVEVTATGPHVPCTQTLFNVRQWLADDAPPYQLYATVDGCDQIVRPSSSQNENKKMRTSSSNNRYSHYVIGNGKKGRGSAAAAAAAM